MANPTNLMDIPSAVKNEVQYLLEKEGGDIVHIGQYEDHEVYQYCFPGEMNTGYPIIILYHQPSGYACEMPPEEGLEILAEIFNK
jgi:hypothetical protein